MRICLGMVSIVLIAVSARAQLKTFELFGYFEPQLTAQYVQKRFVQIQRNKLRIDIASNVSDRVVFKANYDFITYHGTTEINYLDYLPESITGDVSPAFRDLYVLSVSDENFLDNAFLKIAFDRFDVTIGKQQISPGTGYTWNPTDVFNTKDIFDPLYENTGVSAVRVDVPFGGRYGFTFIYSPDNTVRNSGKFLRLKGKAGHFDFSVVGGERLWTLTDFELFKPVEQYRRFFGGDFVGELFGVGTWGEAAYNNMGIARDYVEAVFGADYTFNSELYIMGEYYRNGQGKSGFRQYDLTDWLRSFTAETKTVCRDQLFGYVSYPATELLKIGNSMLACVNDGSFVLVPYLEYNFEENLDITFFGMLFFGTSGRAYSSDLGSGSLLRARYYF